MEPLKKQYFRIKLRDSAGKWFPFYRVSGARCQTGAPNANTLPKMFEGREREKNHIFFPSSSSPPFFLIAEKKSKGADGKV